MNCVLRTLYRIVYFQVMSKHEDRVISNFFQSSYVGFRRNCVGPIECKQNGTQWRVCVTYGVHMALKMYQDNSHKNNNSHSVFTGFIFTRGSAVAERLGMPETCLASMYLARISERLIKRRQKKRNMSRQIGTSKSLSRHLKPPFTSTSWRTLPEFTHSSFPSTHKNTFQDVHNLLQSYLQLYHLTSH